MQAEKSPQLREDVADSLSKMREALERLGNALSAQYRQDIGPEVDKARTEVLSAAIDMRANLDLLLTKL